MKGPLLVKDSFERERERGDGAILGDGVMQAMRRLKLLLCSQDMPIVVITILSVLLP